MGDYWKPIRGLLQDSAIEFDTFIVTLAASSRRLLRQDGPNATLPWREAYRTKTATNFLDLALRHLSSGADKQDSESYWTPTALKSVRFRGSLMMLPRNTQVNSIVSANYDRLPILFDTLDALMGCWAKGP